MTARQDTIRRMRPYKRPKCEKEQGMKKKTLIAVIVMSLMITACGGNTASQGEESKPADSVNTESETEEELPEATAENPLAEEEETDNTPVVDKTVEEAGIEAFVSLPEYHGKEFKKYMMTVTDEDVDNRVASDLEIFTVEMPPDTVIADGMVADIGYVGTVDGVAFEGGSAESYELLIGSHTFVDDFEEQLIGYKAGDEVEVVVNFPEGYSADLGGKEAHFAVKINGVSESLTEPSDEWVAANTEYKTVAEYYEGVRAQLQEEYNKDSDSELHSAVWEETLSSAEFLQYPQNLIDKYAAMVREQLEYMASAYYNTTLDTFMQENGITESYFSDAAKDYVKRELVADYILTKEGVPFDTPMLEEKVKELLAINEISSREEANGLGISDTQIDYAALNNVAVELVISAANVTEVSAEEAEAEDADLTQDNN